MTTPPAGDETRAPEMRPPSAPLYRNAVSLAGGLVVLCSAVLILFGLIGQFTWPSRNPYAGILTYMIFPSFLGVGALLFAIGMRWEAQRRKKQHRLPELPYPVLDLNQAPARRNLALATVGGSVLAVLLAWTVYSGYLYTESVSFCGTTCHVPMEPEHTAYLSSPHARVPCVDCHVGEGASWYVRSKLSGVRQVFAVTLDTFERPIPVPIRDLRPARETCEHCHWPEQFNGAKLLQLPHFRYNESNTAEQIGLVLKIGGGSPKFGLNTGIHWHMVVGNQVTYAAADQQRTKIPWASVRHQNGETVEYVSRRSGLDAAQLGALPRHVMDCMDCHNRPSHGFPKPDSAVDEALTANRISPTLPWIKTVGVRAIMRAYPSRDSAHQGIRAEVNQYYAEKYPEIAARRASDLAAAVDALSTIYDHGVFPTMRVDWATYSSNIGHRYWPGCFRCHDGEHVTASGKVLTHDCDKSCHTMPVRGALARLGEPEPAREADWHPWQPSQKYLSIPGHDRVQCAACHGAGRQPSTACQSCH